MEKVKPHKRGTKKGKTTQVKQYNRKSRPKRVQSRKKQFLRRDVIFNKNSYKTLEEIYNEYISSNQNYKKPLPGMTDPKFSDMELVLEILDKREHHRIWEQGSRWKIESHIDQISPTKSILGHLQKDVIAPVKNPKLRKKNFNDSQTIYLKK